MNVENVNKTINFYELFFHDEIKKDFVGNNYPTKIKNRKNNWTGQYMFCRKLYKLQYEIKKNKKHHFHKTKCKLCHAIIDDTEYVIKNHHWMESLLHYIMDHNHIPTLQFIEFILGHYVSTTENNIIKLPSILYTRNKNKFVKIDKNQLQILDALMMHGSKNVYYDELNNGKYSEHSGVLKLNNNNLESFLIKSKSTTLTKDDPEIFFPANMVEALDNEYIFHTHPPTNGNAGRMDDGVLYEFPSANDVLHFMAHSFFGVTKGSLVVSPEGIYIITKKNKNKPSVLLDRDAKLNFMNKYKLTSDKTQDKYIEYYTNKHTDINSVFYTKISKNKAFLKELNNLLKKYNIVILFYPREKINDKWIMDDIYLKN